MAPGGGGGGALAGGSSMYYEPGEFLQVQPPVASMAERTYESEVKDKFSAQIPAEVLLDSPVKT